ncbi:MAG: hypothetical protein ACJ75I_06850 [Solirubrobacterales bacterium]
MKSIENPEAWMAFEETFMRELHDGAGLEIEEPIRYGAWSGREESAPGFGAKDFVVASKPRISQVKRLYRRARRSVRRRLQ